MAGDLKLKENNTKKQPWTAKRIATTVVIVVLALLMVGGLSYLIIMYQQEHDDTAVFGYYDGQPVKYEANTVFYNTVSNDSNYMNATLSGDWSALYSIWLNGYQSEVIFRALTDLAEKAGVRSPDELVNRLVIGSGIYASEDGSSTFDESVYKATTPANRTAAYNYISRLYPYYVVQGDLQTALVSPQESGFVASMSTDTRSFEYFVVGSNAIPDSVAQEYDSSSVPASKDADGNEVAPTLAEIKAYMFSSDPDAYATYLEVNAIKALDLAKTDFEAAAEEYGNGVVAVNDATINVGNSSVMMNGINNVDSEGHLSSVLTDSLARELYSAEEGYMTDAVRAADGSYVIVRVKSAESDNAWESFISTIYAYYAGQFILNDLSAEVLSSDKFEDNFTEKFITLLLGNASATAAQ